MEENIKTRAEKLYNMAKKAKQLAVNEKNLYMVNQLWPICVALTDKTNYTEESLKNYESKLRYLGYSLSFEEDADRNSLSTIGSHPKPPGTF